MALLNDRKYMVYTNGHFPDQLCLGHLILGDHYSDPVDEISRQSQCLPLNPIDLEKWAYHCDWKGRCVASKGGSLGFGLEAVDLVELGQKIDWTGAKVLEAGSGRKVVLKDPALFLRMKVLSEPATQATLKRWLSTARTNNMFHRFRTRRAKIWMLTGLYELADVRTGSIREKHPSFSIGASSTVMEAATGVPVGPSIELSNDSVMWCEGIVHKPMVYAARYQLLKVTYSKTSSDASRPLEIDLHPDNIYSRGYMLGEDDEKNEDSAANYALLEVSEGTADIENQDTMSPEYWERFDDVQRKYERRKKA